jgi:hypothetical protein
MSAKNRNSRERRVEGARVHRYERQHSINEVKTRTRLRVVATFANENARRDATLRSWCSGRLGRCRGEVCSAKEESRVSRLG